MARLMNDLMSEIEADDKTFGKYEAPLMTKTNIPLFDYLNGQWEYTKLGKTLNCGIDMGKAIYLVGKPGSGKSSFGIQMVGNVMRKFENSDLYIFDFEGSHKESRIKALTGFDDSYFHGDTKRISIKSVDIYGETVLALVYKIYKFKMEHQKELLVDDPDGAIDSQTGKVVKMLPPTFIFIDSIATMNSKAVESAEEIPGQTQGGRTAIFNKALFNKMLQPCLAANIIVVAINHVTSNMSMGVTPPVGQTKFLSNTKAVGGGSGVQFLSNLWIEIDPTDKLDPGAKNNPYGDLKGMRCKFNLVKSRNSEGGKSTTLIFNQVEGFDSDLSTFEFLKNAGAVKGAGIGLYLENLPNTKFRMSKVKEKLATDPEFRGAFDALADYYLKESVSESSKILSEQQEEEQPEVSEEEAVVSADEVVTETVLDNPEEL